MKRYVLILASIGFLLLAPSARLLSVDTAPTVATKEGTVTTVPVSDNDLALRVKNAFTVDKDLSNQVKSVDVKASNGVVTLSGKVDSDKVKNDFAAKAKGVEGVTKVENNLQVK